MLARLRSLLMLTLIPAAAIVTWWAIGDLSEEGAVPSDRALDPPQLSSSTEAAIGLSATFVLVVGAAAAVSDIRGGGQPKRMALTALPLIGLAAYLSLGYRINTASVVGANIGAGLHLMLGLVAVPALIGSSVLIYRTTDRRPDGPADAVETDR